MESGPLAISCFLPMHNEADNIRRVVADAVAALETMASTFEVIVVNDGSRDGTGEIAEELAAGDPRVRVVHHEVNRGYGGAVIGGIRAARLDYVFFTDGDGQFKVSDLRRFLPRLAHADAVVGYRIDRRDSWVRKFNGAAWTLLMDFLLRLRIRDLDCAFKVFRRDLFDGMPLHSQGAMISAEILSRLRRRRARIVEMGVSHYPRLAGESSGGSVRVILKAFRELRTLAVDLRADEGGKPR